EPGGENQLHHGRRLAVHDCGPFGTHCHMWPWCDGIRAACSPTEQFGGAVHDVSTASADSSTSASAAILRPPRLARWTPSCDATVTTWSLEWPEMPLLRFNVGPFLLVQGG